jgi:hypothetical protein
MNPSIAQVDPWPKILDLLHQCCPPEHAEGHLKSATKPLSAGVSRHPHAKKQRVPALRKPQGFSACVTIHVRELTESSATIGWYDPTCCRYEDQRWCRFKALRAGVCAMTGALIAAGADAFHPARGRRVPTNVGAMILAHALQCATVGM